ncbi:MAG: UvrD-helicase domain-containing protein [Desulfovibrionaceae bacterium]|nr:UvrD-helicase domain-containing protein [Desulfovibrionaceae bacterium]
MERIFRADLHMHSRFSMATSRKLNVQNIAAWSQIKGLSVTACGDATHPAWRDELRRDLIFDDNTGLYRVRDPRVLASEAESSGLVCPENAEPPFFLIEAEISSIYKKNGRVRKIHNLVIMPDLESMDRLCSRLESVGNLASDGRPILGLDAEYLLEMVLECNERAVLIPAHIWTPWFSLFGSRSGFDSPEECFGSLTDHIFAMETGLSSDPDMNRLWSALDRFTLVSNSDAHSGENLGREANIFTGDISYDGIFDALRRQPQTSCHFLGTAEFFPEEGKYHLDGHRACGISLSPEETRRMDLICPVCGKPVTVGVLHRVTALADRHEPLYPDGQKHFVSLIPLPELLGELLGCGAKSVKVRKRQRELLAKFGSELDILHSVPEGDLRGYWHDFGEAVSRMRKGDVILRGGYDGEYGTVRVFHDFEQKERIGRLLIPVEEKGNMKKACSCAQQPEVAETKSVEQPVNHRGIFTWSRTQREALEADSSPVLVFAGPGSGKTRTLVGRAERLLQSGVSAEALMILTFTRKAAEEVRNRLQYYISADSPLPAVDTMHALALTCLSEQPEILTESSAVSFFYEANLGEDPVWLQTAWKRLEKAREMMSIPDELQLPLQRYRNLKRKRGVADYADLLERWLDLLRTHPEMKRPAYLLVDEIQDLSSLQIEIIRALLPDDGTGFFGIGDPNQAIYGFRGADPDAAERLVSMWPGCRRIVLTENYRSAAEIVKAASTLIDRDRENAFQAVRQESGILHFCFAPDGMHEAEWIAGRISDLLGSSSHTAEDLRHHERTDSDHLYAPGDIAVLVRFKGLIPVLKKALDRKGIPYAVPEEEAFWEDADLRTLLRSVGKHLQERQQKLSSGCFEMEEEKWRSPRTLAAFLFQDKTFLPESQLFRCLEKAFNRCGGWQGLLDWVSLRRDQDLAAEHSEYVRLMTMHAAKGLEFSVVFLPSLEEGLMPFSRNDAKQTERDVESMPADVLDEERRVLYVGLTRAKDGIFASCAKKRMLYGLTRESVPSRFLKPILPYFVQTHLIQRLRTKARQMTLIS